MKLATIQRIHSIQPHPDPEVNKIECAKIKEWPVVIPKGQYNEGQLVIFIEIDSVLPEVPHFEFLRKQKFRIWNARFKGAPSSGLVQPISLVGELYTHLAEPWALEGCVKVTVPGHEKYIGVGDDVTDILGVTKYEKPIDLSVNGDAKGNFPTNIISITDETNALGYPEAFRELEGKQIYITQKADGSSVTFIRNIQKEGEAPEFTACSRKLALKEGSGFPWRIVNKYDIKTKLEQRGLYIAIQGEAIGPKLNGNRSGLKEIDLKVFRMKDLVYRNILGFDQLVYLCKELQLPMVDLIEITTYDPSIHTIEWFRNLANSQVWKTNGEKAEGIVVAPTIPFYSRVLKKEWSVKFINQDYKQ